MEPNPSLATQERAFTLLCGGEPLLTLVHEGERRRYVLEDTGFNEVPKKMRRFYRKWGGQTDVLAPNEVLCPVCKVVIRSTQELQPGDRVFCLPCMTKLTVVVGKSGKLEATSRF
ncbi:MAG TPA: hypothetical protein VN634_11275 [Candidatus Limnocylindrales bacterium]|nr:hypothetical protein [Candidatus Limnocylindrales bacterium]